MLTQRLSSARAVFWDFFSCTTQRNLIRNWMGSPQRISSDEWGLFCSSYCKGLLALMSCKQPQKPLSSVLSSPRCMCVRIPLLYTVFFSSKLVNICQILLLSFCCFPLGCLGGCNSWQDRVLLCLRTNISQKMEQGFSLVFENCPNPPLLSKPSPGFPAVPQSRSFPGFSKSFTGIPVPKSFLKNPCHFPVPAKYPCIRRFKQYP